MIVEPEGRKCGCGSRGCLEQYASANAVAKRAKEQVVAAMGRAVAGLAGVGGARRAGRSGSVDGGGALGVLLAQRGSDGAVTCKEVFEAAEAGDVLALDVVRETARYLAVGCINFARITDPSMIVFSGGMAAAGDMLLDMVRHDFQALGWDVLEKPQRIVQAEAGPLAGLIGAAKAARDDSGRRGQAADAVDAALDAAGTAGTAGCGDLGGETKSCDESSSGTSGTLDAKVCVPKVAPTAVVIGVDGGSTHTCAVVIDGATKQCIGRGERGSCNQNSVGEAVARQNIHGAIRDALASARIGGGDGVGGEGVEGGYIASIDCVRGVCLGLSGVDRPPDVALVETWMRQLKAPAAPAAPAQGKSPACLPVDCEVIIHNDAVAALASGTLGALEGVVVISGTGMIAYVGKRQRDITYM